MKADVVAVASLSRGEWGATASFKLCLEAGVVLSSEASAVASHYGWPPIDWRTTHYGFDAKRRFGDARGSNQIAWFHGARPAYEGFGRIAKYITFPIDGSTAARRLTF